jgi:hypothetical protein
MAEVDMVLRREFEPLFGPTIDQPVDLPLGPDHLHKQKQKVS